MKAAAGRGSPLSKTRRAGYLSRAGQPSVRPGGTGVRFTGPFRGSWQDQPALVLSPVCRYRGWETVRGGAREKLVDRGQRCPPAPPRFAAKATGCFAGDAAEETVETCWRDGGMSRPVAIGGPAHTAARPELGLGDYGDHLVRGTFFFVGRPSAARRGWRGHGGAAETASLSTGLREGPTEPNAEQDGRHFAKLGLAPGAG